MGFQGGRAPLAAGGITPVVNLKKRKREALGLLSSAFYADFF